MFCADQIAQLADDPGRTEEVSEFTFVIEGCGVPNDVVMNVRFVSMSTNDESIVAFQKPLRTQRIQRISKAKPFSPSLPFKQDPE